MLNSNNPSEVERERERNIYTYITMAMAVKGDMNAVVPNKMKLERMLSMKGGKGDSSYLKNSQAQARHARSMLHFLEAMLNSIQLLAAEEEGRPVVVADLGCSCGGNTLFIMDIVVGHVSKMYEAAGRDAPEFQVFFSDLPGNDFNVLFQLLPPMSSGSLEECLAAASADARRSYFAAGVPGSFYGRLFPARSVDVFHSTFSLHWLSQVPESVTDRRSAAYNKDKVFVHGAPKSVSGAYRHQFRTDLATFLQCRASEMRHGGVMFLVCLGRTSADPSDQGGASLLFGAHFQEAWNDLVDEGLLEREKRDSFNIPVYAPSLEEFRAVVKANGSFAINRLELVKGGSPLVVNRPDDAAEVGRALANSCRSVAGVLVDAHIGESLSEELFTRLQHRAARHARELLEQMQFYHIVASLSLSLP